MREVSQSSRFSEAVKSRALVNIIMAGYSFLARRLSWIDAQLLSFVKSGGCVDTLLLLPSRLYQRVDEK